MSSLEIVQMKNSYLAFHITIITYLGLGGAKIIKHIVIVPMTSLVIKFTHPANHEEEIMRKRSSNETNNR